MVDFESLNLRELRTQYHDESIRAAAIEALSVVRLRDSKGVSDALAESIGLDDVLLRYYGLMEVATIARYVPWPLPEEYRRAALDELEGVARDERLDLLAELHVRRLRGELDAVEDDDPDTPLYALYGAFLDVNTLIDREEARAFLASRADEKTLRELLAALGSEALFIERMSVSPVDRSRTDQALNGFTAFSSFVQEFDALLRTAERVPLAQSAFWCFHARLFDRTRGVLGPLMRDCFAAVASWKAVEGLDEVPFGESLDRLEQMLAGLQSVEYSRPVQDALNRSA
jgi:hypothetical protein